jgi:hypothetical protein
MKPITNTILILALLLSSWLGANFTQAQTPGTALAWGIPSRPVPDAAQSGVVAAAAGNQLGVVLKADGSVVTWNYFGETEVPLAARSGVKAIAAGPGHILGLKSNGTVVAWGYNAQGQVTGIPTTDWPQDAIADPVTLGGQVLSGVSAIVAGGAQSVAVKVDGSVVVWGDNSQGQANVPGAAQSGVITVAAGAYHTVALMNNGSVVAWGQQTNGPVAAQSGVQAIAAYGWHTVALKTNGSVVEWGDSGQWVVPAEAQSGVAAIAAGSGHTVVLKTNGSVFGWGSNQAGELTIPAGLSKVTAIAAGTYLTVVVYTPTAPVLTAEPANQTVKSWQRASFSVSAEGFPLNYQWRKDDVDIAGATNATYSLANASPNDAGNYSVRVFNSAGSVTSSPPAVLTRPPRDRWWRGAETIMARRPCLSRRTVMSWQSRRVTLSRWR